MGHGRGSAWHDGSGIRRSEIVTRAESWLRVPVPHHRNRFHHNEYGIYRTDAPGYVSMAWAVLGDPPRRHGGLDIAGLAAVTEVIAVAELRAGDALLRPDPAGHVALFHEWADASRESYWGFEQAEATGTVHRAIAFPHDVIDVTDATDHSGDPARGYLPRRYRHLTD